MNVPLLDLQAHHKPMRREIMAALEQAFDSQAFILGPEVNKLEDRISTYCQTYFGIAVFFGTDVPEVWGQLVACYSFPRTNPGALGDGGAVPRPRLPLRLPPK